MKKRGLISFSAFLQSVLFAVLLTLVVGYVFGFRAFLVNGWSSEPEIQYHSLIIDYKCSYDDLYKDFINAQTNGENIYITFSKKGKSFTTHAIMKMKANQNEYFEVGDTVSFDNMGIQFNITVSQRCQIITMTNNEKSYKNFIQDIKDNHGGISDGKSGPSFEQNVYSAVHGKVVHIFEKSGQFIFYIKNNFLQIVAYVIILYIAFEMFKFVPSYIKNY